MYWVALNLDQVSGTISPVKKAGHKSTPKHAGHLRISRNLSSATFRYIGKADLRSTVDKAPSIMIHAKIGVILELKRLDPFEHVLLLGLLFELSWLEPAPMGFSFKICVSNRIINVEPNFLFLMPFFLELFVDYHIFVVASFQMMAPLRIARH